MAKPPFGVIWLDIWQELLWLIALGICCLSDSILRYLAYPGTSMDICESSMPVLVFPLVTYQARSLARTKSEFISLVSLNSPCQVTKDDILYITIQMHMNHDCLSPYSRPSRDPK
ncbi:hypothetical protein F4677DRAFT_14328 [Hypoxylon crocopeplum]|nr:hypothetical protein F4677DRAFT_14328 [Hypoxylon crocopeplum]